jgi:predicted membrane protein
VESLFLSLTQFVLPVSQSAAKELIVIFLTLWLFGFVLLIIFYYPRDESFREIWGKSIIATYFITIIVLNILLCSYFLSKWLYIFIVLVTMSLIKNIADRLYRYSTKIEEK